ncbi:hypothetical protein CPB97_002980, partial [Podila verticillata]
MNSSTHGADRLPCDDAENPYSVFEPSDDGEDDYSILEPSDDAEDAYSVLKTYGAGYLKRVGRSRARDQAAVLFRRSYDSWIESRQARYNLANEKCLLWHPRYNALALTQTPAPARAPAPANEARLI